jgi:hypothetical protein
MGPGGLAGQKNVADDRNDRREHERSGDHRRPTQPAKPDNVEAIKYPRTDSGASHISPQLEAGAVKSILLPADFIGDALGGGLALPQVYERQWIGLELT